jgi:HEAT repeat protein
MSTLAALQRLDDGNFHRLADDFLRHLEIRYRHLRTHGVNQRGESIVGQPDSYVGESATSFSIGFCYSVQRKGWWRKIVDDVKQIVAVCPSVVEIVAAISRDSDRDGPKRKRSEWLSDAKKAAGTASFRLIDGRDISRHLDNDHQDLRRLYLGIPYSRLNGEGILASAQRATNAAIEAMQAAGRFDPKRYIRRSADHELYNIWQKCLRNDASEKRVAPIRLVALVNDSGVGKTSLVCSFAKSFGRVLPVILVQARDLTFAEPESLVTHVVHALQGVLDPSLRVGEEAAIAKHLSVTFPLTLIVDGLDETHVFDGVKKAIAFWLESRLGEKSLLIISSRREFWRQCRDEYWERWMPGRIVNERSPSEVTDRSGIKDSDRNRDVQLPDRFTEAELEAAWIKADRSLPELSEISTAAREELRHPFTLRVYLDLIAQKHTLLPVLTKEKLLEAWLNQRLRNEELPAEHLTPQLYGKALRIVATKIASAKGGDISVDALVGVPRFDPAHPPGIVVRRLINANILESVPTDSNRVRFTFEAVQDFYRAEADIENIKSDLVSVSQRFALCRFSDVYARLSRIGSRIAEDDIRHPFINCLIELAPKMAAVVISAAAMQYSNEIRVRIAEHFEKDILSRHRVKGAFAIYLLRNLECPEAITVLTKYLLPPAEPHAYLKPVAAMEFLRLGYANAAGFVYRWVRLGIFSGNDTYYFSEDLAIFRRSNLGLRQALVHQASQHIHAPSGAALHCRAVYVLSCLREDELVQHLQARLEANGLLHHYENHALLALGTSAAGALFVRSVLAVGKKLRELPNDASNHDARNELIGLVHLLRIDARYLIDSEFEPYLLQLIESDNIDVSWIACDLVRRAQVTSLFFKSVVAGNRWNRSVDFSLGNERDSVTSEMWCDWWSATNDISIKKRLLKLLPRCPSVDLEEILMECLDSPELRGHAARPLGEYGAVRSAPRLRSLLRDGKKVESWERLETAHALGDLRDNAAVTELKAMISVESERTMFAAGSLGVIGTPEAERALTELLQEGNNGDQLVRALLACGTASAVAVAIEQAKKRSDGSEWLCQQARHLSWPRGWCTGSYYTHINTRELVDYLYNAYQSKPYENHVEFLRAFDQIDNSEIRSLLREYLERRGTAADAKTEANDTRRLSDFCATELKLRGDDVAIPYVLDQRSPNQDKFYVAMMDRDLRHFNAGAVAAELRNRLSIANEKSVMVALIALLGRFGDSSDEELLRKFLNNDDDLIANVACEAHLRLTDPILVPEGWREV